MKVTRIETLRCDVDTHNFYGHLSSVISAHFCAAVPNLRIMETDVDAVPWRYTARDI